LTTKLSLTVTWWQSRTSGIYYGLPDGYELEIFLGVLRAASGLAPSLGAESMARLRGLPRRVQLEVIVSPT
jgi:hypothetical protein